MPPCPPAADPHAARPRSGGRLLVDALVAHGAERVFCVPGESFLAALDALRDAPSLDTIVCRMEAGAANMACAHGRLTGSPGLCFVGRGPGAAHAAVGVHTAQQGSVAMLLLVGQVPRSHRGREAFQEVDIDAMFAPLAKWTATAQTPEQIPELVRRAYATATAGRPGPVVLALPEDVLAEEVSTALSPDHGPIGDTTPAPAPVEDAALQRLGELVGAAQRPLVIVGGGGWSQRAALAATGLCDAWGLPVATAFRCQDYVDNRSASYCGTLGLGMDPRLAARAREADLVLAIGARLDEPTTGGYTILQPPRPRQTLIHVHGDRAELGRVYEPALAICADSAEFTAALAALPAPAAGRWAEWSAAAARDARTFRQPAGSGPGGELARAVAGIRDALGPDAIVANGAGNYTLWCHRYWRFDRFGTQVAPVGGAMGFGVPAAIAAKLAHPDRPVISFNGDGCFLMCGQELATAARHDVAAVHVVIDNSGYGTIRMHQERRYPGRRSATELINPDFVAYARAFGLDARSARDGDELVDAVSQAARAGRPALVHFPLAPDVFTPPIAA